MKKITIALCLILPIFSKAQLFIASNEELYLNGTFYSGTILNNAGKLTVEAGTTVILNGGSSSGTGTIKGSSTSSLSLGGTSTNGTYYFDQSTAGTTNVLKDLTLTESATATLGNAIDIIGGASPGTVKVGSGTTLYTGNFLTLKSDANGTACIGISYGTISGNLTVERYIPANGRRYRHLASPVVGGTTLQWRNNGLCNSGRGILITGPTGPVDSSLSNDKSAMYYNETNTTGDINNAAKWPAIDGNSVITNGRGYRVFVRGDRTISLLTPNTINNATTIWVNGSYPSGTITLPVTYTSNGGQGWNLVGNPYPCNIDWNAASGWTKTNVGTGIAIYRPSTNSFAYSLSNSNASGGLIIADLNGGSSIIGSGQGFFVKTTSASPMLKCTEAVKITSAPPTLLLKKTASNQLRIKLTKDSTNVDETLILFGSNFNDEFIENEDLEKLANLTVNVSSILGKELYAAINFTSNNYTEKTIPLSVWGNINGNYQLDLTQVDGFDAAISIYLKDKYLNTTTAIDQDKNISFTINSDSLSKGDKRYELLFKNAAVGTNELDNALAKAQIKVYPNPASDILNISLSNTQYKNSRVSVFSATGQEVLQRNMADNTAQLNITNLSNGIYFVSITNQSGFNKTVIFVK